MSLRRLRSVCWGVLPSKACNPTRCLRPVLLALLPLASGWGQTCSQVPSGLVGWWAAEGNAADAVTGSAASLLGGAGFAAGQVGQAFSLDGVDDAGMVANAVSLNPTGGITITAWIRPLGTVTSFPSPGSIRAIVSKPSGPSWTSPYASYNLRIRGAEEAQQLEFWTNDFSREMNSTTSIPVGVWTFVAATYDGASQKIYVNGVLDATRVVTGAILPSAENLMIGSRSVTSPGEFFNGNIDEPDIYRRALTAAEIAAIYSAGAAGKCGNVPIINITSLPDGQVGGSYSQSLQPILGNPPYSFTVVAGALPVGLSLNASLGAIAGTPTAAGTSTFTVRVADSSGRTSQQTLSLTITVPPTCAQPPPGLVGWWAAEGNAVDGVTGTSASLLGGTAFAAGLAGQAFSFDGLDDAVSVANSATLNSSSGITITAWVRPLGAVTSFPSPGSIRAIVSKPSGPSWASPYATYNLRIRGAEEAQQLEFWTNDFSREMNSTASIPVGVWTFVAATYDGASQKIYVNGVLDATRVVTGAILPSAENLMIGSRSVTSPGEFFNGNIDELDIYRRALTAAEIAAIYSAGAAGKCGNVPIVNITSLPDGQVGGSYSQSLQPVLGTPPYSFTVVGGTLPVGLSLDASLGAIAGTPTAAGTSTFTVRVTDSSGRSSQQTLSLTVAAPQANQIYDLSADWSYVSNPNGVWSYNEGLNPLPLQSPWSPSDPNSPPGWAYAQWPNFGHVPIWGKVTAAPQFIGDTQTGDVVVHSSDSGRGENYGPANVTWTSPSAGTITISGSAWIDHLADRSNKWNVYLNGALLSTGNLLAGGGYYRSAPFDFSTGSGGAGVLTNIPVAAGNVVKLEVVKLSTFGSFAGVNLRITFSQTVGDTAGPVTSGVAVSPSPAAAGTSLSLVATVDDSSTGNSKTTAAEYALNGGLYAPLASLDGAFDEIREDVGSNFGPLTSAGLYNLCVRGRDVHGNIGAHQCFIVPIYDPSAGFVTGGGSVTSPAGADLGNLGATGEARFGFVSKYLPGRAAPDGSLEFQFQAGNLNFKSTSMEWLVVTNEPRAIFRGEGKINGAVSCKFEADTWDGSLQPGGKDAFGLKIFSCAGGGDRYRLDASPLTKGQIIIHR